jgi:hypothetical protein
LDLIARSALIDVMAKLFCRCSGLAGHAVPQAALEIGFRKLWGLT